MKKLLVLFLMISTYFISGCSLFSSSAPKKHYYQIYYKPKTTLGRKISGTLRIKPFEVNKVYDRHNIVYRKSVNEMFYYNRKFWASKPSDMITDVLANHATETQLFSDIILELTKKPDYVLTGRILALDELDSGEKWFARVSIIFELKDYKTDVTIVSHSFERRKEVKIKDVVYVVRAMSEIIEEETEVFFNKIYEKLNFD